MSANESVFMYRQFQKWVLYFSPTFRSFVPVSLRRLKVITWPVTSCRSHKCKCRTNLWLIAAKIQIASLPVHMFCAYSSVYRIHFFYPDQLTQLQLFMRSKVFLIKGKSMASQLFWPSLHHFCDGSVARQLKQYCCEPIMEGTHE